MPYSAEPFALPVTVRYFEADQQGVVYHMWYLAYFEDARNAFLETQGCSLHDLLASGYDLKVARVEIDWSAALVWSREARITVRPARIGTSSFTLEFTAYRDEIPCACGRTVYVVIDESGKKAALPHRLRTALNREPQLTHRGRS